MAPTTFNWPETIWQKNDFRPNASSAQTLLYCAPTDGFRPALSKFSRWAENWGLISCTPKSHQPVFINYNISNQGIDFINNWNWFPKLPFLEHYISTFYVHIREDKISSSVICWHVQNASFLSILHKLKNLFQIQALKSLSLGVTIHFNFVKYDKYRQINRMIVHIHWFWLKLSVL